jgi:hypothetical protein
MGWVNISLPECGRRQQNLNKVRSFPVDLNEMKELFVFPSVRFISILDFNIFCEL